MLLAVNANSPFKEPCKGWTKIFRVFGTGKSRAAWAIKLHVEIDRNDPLKTRIITQFLLPSVWRNLCAGGGCCLTPLTYTFIQTRNMTPYHLAWTQITARWGQGVCWDRAFTPDWKGNRLTVLKQFPPSDVWKYILTEYIVISQPQPYHN